MESRKIFDGLTRCGCHSSTYGCMPNATWQATETKSTNWSRKKELRNMLNSLSLFYLTRFLGVECWFKMFALSFFVLIRYFFNIHVTKAGYRQIRAVLK